MARHIHDLFWQLHALRQHIEQNGGLLNDIGQSQSDREAKDRSLDVASRESMKECREALRQANKLTCRFDD